MACLKMNEEKKGGKRRQWEQLETEALLQMYKSRKAETLVPRKKKFAFDRMLEDLGSMGILQAPTTSLQLQMKIDSLQRAHHCARLSEEKLGKGSSGFEYMTIMDEIFEAPSTSVPATNSSLSLSVESSLSTPSSLTSSANAVKLSQPNWTSGEVRALLTCYDSRKEELQHPKKMKNFYQNVCEDLLSMGIFKRKIDASKVENKMNNLLQAYKSAKDTEKRTGRASAMFNYMSEMDEIFGNRPIIANDHTKNLYGEQIEALSVEPSKTATISTNLTDYELDTEQAENDSCDASITIDNDAHGMLNIDDIIETDEESIELIDDANNDMRSVESHIDLIDDQPPSSSNRDKVSTNIKPISGSLGMPKTLNSKVFDDQAGCSSTSEKGSNKTKIKSSIGTKPKKLPYSFQRNKTTKEIVQEQKQKWENEKLKKKAEFRQELFRIADLKKQQRHDEKCEIMKKILEKM